MHTTTIFRKRFIPFETVDISGDEVLLQNDELLVTRWKAIKPRNDISGGVSCAFLKDGIKISRFYNHSQEFVYWYCDIIDVEYDKEKDQYTFTDLLVDVKIFPDGRIEILDVEEVAEALEQDIITKDHACRALRKLNFLLQMIYSENFPPEVCKEYR